MRVYRIENSYGMGPYSMDSPMILLWRYGVQELNANPVPYDLAGKHPPPDHDSGLTRWWRKHSKAPNGKFIFGFASIEQLQTWFYWDGWLKQMEDNGFHLSVYDAPDAIVGRAQVVFETRLATLVETRKLTSILH